MKISSLFNYLRDFYQHARERRRLLEMTDRKLADIGISRELLDRGVGAWPWRAETEDQLELSPISWGVGPASAGHRPGRDLQVESNRADSPSDRDEELRDTPWAA